MTFFQNVNVSNLLHVALKTSSVIASLERISYTPDTDVLSAGTSSSVNFPCRIIASVYTETDAKTTLSTSVLNASVLTESVGVTPSIGDVVTINAGKYVGRKFKITKAESTDVGGVCKVRGVEV